MTAADFPVHRVEPGDCVFRIFRVRDRFGRVLAPWTFSSRDITAKPGRFDLDAPKGTCYTSDKEIGAWLEVFRHLSVVVSAEVDLRHLARIERTGHTVPIADLCHPRVPPFAVTLDMFAGDDYAKPQQLARTLSNSGYGGLRALLRHDPTTNSHNIAVFGDAGKPSEVPGWQVETEPAGGNRDLLAELSERGIAIQTIPHHVATIPPSR